MAGSPFILTNFSGNLEILQFRREKFSDLRVSIWIIEVPNAHIVVALASSRRLRFRNAKVALP